MKLLVASKSHHKATAVMKAASTVFAGNVFVDVDKAASDINEQPVGHVETLLGANNRLSNLKASSLGSAYDLLVSIESGIFSVGANWWDLAWVIVEDQAGNQVSCPSAGIELPADAVEEARQRGFETTTVGWIIGKRYGPGFDSDGTDPHSDLTGGKVGRADVLEAALTIALAQYNENYG